MDITEGRDFLGCILQDFLTAVYPGKLQTLAVRDMSPGTLHKHPLYLFLPLAHGCQLFYGFMDHFAYFSVYICPAAGVHIGSAAFFGSCIAFPAQLFICLLHCVAGHVQIFTESALRHEPLSFFQSAALNLCDQLLCDLKIYRYLSAFF